MPPTLGETLSDDQLHQAMRGFGTLTFIAAVLVAGLVMFLTLLVARRVARRVRRQIESELELRQATRTDSVWSAAGDRVEVEPDGEEEDDDAEDDDEDDENRGWRPEDDEKNPRW